MSNLALGKITNLSVEAGSPEWHYERGLSFCASEATTLMGFTNGKSRDDLIKEKATGIVKAVSDYTEKVVFARGHRVEDLARPIAEKRLDDDLTPEVFVRTVNGMRLLASLDGVTMPTRHTAWECKQFNKELFAIVSSGGELTEKHYWQLEQQILVADIKELRFACSDGTEECYAELIYESRPERREKLVLAWEQFAVDLAAYVLPEESAPTLIAAPVDTLPAINYKIDFSNGVSLKHNLSVFKEAALRLAEKSKEPLKTDQDFEDAKARIKAYKAAEENCTNLIARVLGEMGDVDTFAKDLTEIQSFIAKARLTEDKQIKTRNEEIKAEIISEARKIVADHIAALNTKLTPLFVPLFNNDFAGAIKGKSSFDNMRSAVSSMIANAKIEANRLASHIEANREIIRTTAPAMDFLFADMQQLCGRDTDYVRAITEKRVADHEKSVQEKIQAEQKASDEKRAKEEVARRLKAEADTEAEKQRQAASAKAQPSETNSASEAQAAEAPIELLSEISNSAARIVSTTREFVEQNQVQDDEHQRGLIAGLELSLKLFEKYGPHNFEKAVREFIEVGKDNGLVEAA